MIAYIIGKVADINITENNVVLEAGQIGYNVKISSQTAEMLPRIGEEVKLYTYTLVREDAFQLYGFVTKDDLEIFKKLITVNGIGPKGGLAILSAMSADNLRFAVLSGDAKEIAKAPGIGKKTAERIILDLKDKISLEDTMISREMSGANLSTPGMEEESVGREAAEALTALGYSYSDAWKAVQRVEITEDMDAGEILKQALKKII